MVQMFTRKLKILQITINKSSKMAGYKINIQKMNYI